MTGKIGKADKADVMTVGIRFSFFHAQIPASLMGFLHQMQPGMLWKQGGLPILKFSTKNPKKHGQELTDFTYTLIYTGLG